MRNDHFEDNDDRSRDPRDAAFDDGLKNALRAEDPGAAFTQRVLARAREERAAQQSGRPLHIVAIGQTVERASEVSPRHSSEVLPMTSEVSSRPSRARTQRLTMTRKLIAALAASLTLAAAGAQYLQHRRYVAEGERARAQVLAALRLTNEKLDIVHDKIAGREHAR